MPALYIASPNQIAATSGRLPRLSLAAAMREATPTLYANREFAQAQSGLDLQERALELQEGEQAGQRRQQTAANLISGGGTLAQAGLAAKQLGLLGGTAATAPAAAATSVLPATATGTTAVAGEGAALGFGATAGEVGAAGATPGLSLSGLAAPAAGGLAGGLVGGPIGRAAGGGTRGGLVGATTGGAAGAGAAIGTGALLGAPLGPAGIIGGALLGGLTGGLGGSGLCILHEAAYGVPSREVTIARKFRDTFLTTAQLRAYYTLYEGVAQRMRADHAYRVRVRHELTDKLVRYGAAVLGIDYARPTQDDVEVSRTFLTHLATQGTGLGPVRRAGGEVI